jgi:hypothetical protein
MQVALICSDEIPSEWWQAAMPGVVVKSWRAVYAKPQRLSNDRGEAIRLALEKLSPRQDAIATRTLKKLAGLDGLSSSAFKYALKSVSVPAWQPQGRSFIRNPFV